MTLDEYRARIGAPAVASEWNTVDQETVDRFAALTGDDAFIHIDPVRAAGTRYGGTVAHGLLVAALLPMMMRSATPLIRSTVMGANYGFEHLRFPSSLRVGSQVRGWFALADIEDRGPDLVMLHFDVSVEAEGQAKPVLTTRWLITRWMKPASEVTG